MFMKANNPCADPECPYCGLHCPYCGTTGIFLDPHEVHMGCPACRKGEALPAAEFVQMRHRQVQDLTGRTIADWKARARQLSAPFHWRWRTAMCYLDPVSSAAISRCDDLMLNGLTYVDAMAHSPRQNYLYLSAELTRPCSFKGSFTSTHGSRCQDEVSTTEKCTCVNLQGYDESIRPA